MGPPKLILQVDLQHPNCACSPIYLSPCSHDPASCCLCCRKLRTSCQQAFQYRPACLSLHKLACNNGINLPCRHSHSAQEASCAGCSSIFEQALSPHEQAPCAYNRHSKEALCFRCNSKTAISNQPVVTIASICKASPADAGCGFCSKSQEELAAERRGWQWGLGERISYREDAERLHCCLWPPPSFSCTFCCRTFTSAQALGGHMNIHRHERARLRQFSQPATDAPLTSFTAVPLPAFCTHDDMPCFNHSSAPVMISSSNVSSCSSVQNGIQASKKVGEDRREKLLEERTNEKLPIKLVHHEHFLINNQNKQEVSCVDLELRLGRLPTD